MLLWGLLGIHKHCTNPRPSPQSPLVEVARLLGTGAGRGSPGPEAAPSWISCVNRSVYGNYKPKCQNVRTGERRGKLSETMQAGSAGRGMDSLVPASWHISGTQVFEKGNSLADQHMVMHTTTLCAQNPSIGFSSLKITLSIHQWERIWFGFSVTGHCGGVLEVVSHLNNSWSLKEAISCLQIIDGTDFQVT